MRRSDDEIAIDNLLLNWRISVSDFTLRRISLSATLSDSRQLEHPSIRQRRMRQRDMEYDAFLCRPHEDTQLALLILKYLEANNYKVCYHLRDFEVGETIDNNICKAIQKSKRTVCLVSNRFARSSFCMREFEVALHRNTMLRKKRLILVVLEAIEAQLFEGGDSITASLKHYLTSHTYIDYTSNGYQKRLLYAMTVKKIGQAVQNAPLNHEYDITRCRIVVTVPCVDAVNCHDLETDVELLHPIDA